MKLANREKIPVTPRGGGTNVSGGSVPIQGGIVLCTTKMNRILKIDKENLTATVEPGVVLQDLTIKLATEGLFFPPDPQSFLGATMGGIISENAGGPACVKYGVTKQYILGIEVVLPTGEIVNLGGRTLKNVVGYDLLHIFISSEGTLGVITKAELKLRPMSPFRKTLMAVYADVSVAGESVYRVLENGVIPGKIELLDNWIINRIEEMMPMGLPKDADAVLLFECDGIPEAVEKEIEKVAEIVKEVRRRRCPYRERPGRSRPVLDGPSCRLCRHLRQDPHGPLRRCHRPQRQHPRLDQEESKRSAKNTTWRTAS